MKNKLFISFFLLLFGNSFSQTACVQYDSNFTGYCSEFHPNGKTKWVKEFQDGRAVGIWMNFDEKGNLVKQLNTSLKRDSLLKNYEKFKFEYPQYVEVMKVNESRRDFLEGCIIPEEAKFPGREDALRKFMKLSMVFPQSALDKKIVGKVYTRFCVEKDGSISEIEIVKGIENCPECSEEVIRLLKLMPNWIPGIENGKTTRSYCQMPFNFTTE